jgi:hypothetical protein
MDAASLLVWTSNLVGPLIIAIRASLSSRLTGQTDWVWIRIRCIRNPATLAFHRFWIVGANQDGVKPGNAI